MRAARAPGERERARGAALRETAVKDRPSTSTAQSRSSRHVRHSGLRSADAMHWLSTQRGSAGVTRGLPSSQRRLASAAALRRASERACSA